MHEHALEKPQKPPVQIAPDACPYCAESLPTPRPSKCPHCSEFLNPVMLREALELERYSRCPRGLRAVAGWYKFQGALFCAGGVGMLMTTMAHAASSAVVAAFAIAAMGVGFWRVGDGVRRGRRWARSWALGLACLQLFGKGMFIGIACLVALNGDAARAYFADRD